MIRNLSIGGREIPFVWNNEVARRYQFRLGTIGGPPSQRELRNGKTAEAAICKLLWALLPAQELATYPTPEDLFCDMEDSDPEKVSATLVGIFADMNPTAEKKSALTKSPSPESNSA